MSGWCPSSSVCGMAVECTAAVLPSAWCGSCPTHPIAVLASTAVMSCTVLCQVCGVWVVGVCLWCSCGGVSSVHSPLTLVVGGAIVDGGVLSWMVGGMVSEGRLCCWYPRRMSVSPVCVLASPFRLCDGPVEWRVWCVVVLPPLSRIVPVFFMVFPVFELDLAPRIVQFLFVSHSFVLCCPPFFLCCCVVVLCVENGRVVCVGGNACGVYCPRIIHVVACISVVCVMAVLVLFCRIVLWVVEWRWGVCLVTCLSSLPSSSCSFCFFLLLVSFLFLLCWCSG